MSTLIPTAVYAGDSFSVKLLLLGYRSTDGWTAHLRMAPRTPGNDAIELASQPEDIAHRIAVPAATTADWHPDGYTGVIWVSRGGEAATITSSETIDILPNPRTVEGGFDGRSVAARTLADLITAKAAWDTTRGLQRRYKIAGREMEFATEAELVQKIVFWENMVAREQMKAVTENGGRPRNRILTRFVRPR